MTISTIVEARFAGGRIELTVSELAHAPDQRVVTVDLPGGSLALYPDEARDLARALHATASMAETNAPGRNDQGHPYLETVETADANILSPADTEP